MRGLDETDRELLRLLLADGRRPYSELAEAVDLSAPAVSDRVERLEEVGLLRRFTVDLDHELLTGRERLLVLVEAVPGAGPDVAAAVRAAEAVEHTFRTADDHVVCTATVAEADDVAAFLPTEDVRSYDVRPVAAESWTPRLGGTEFAPDCDECGNAVTAEGETTTLDGTVHHFCCENCRETFTERYERLREGARTDADGS
jgi:DNA-binding Lrp family transcriptional regulator